MGRPALIVYDILDDRRRRAVRAVLSLSALRFQQSAWVLPAGLADLGGLWRAVRALAGDRDRVRLQVPCAACRRGLRVWPPGGLPLTVDYTTGVVAKERPLWGP